MYTIVEGQRKIHENNCGRVEKELIIDKNDQLSKFMFYLIMASMSQKC